MKLFLFCALIGSAGAAASEALWRRFARELRLNRYERLASAALMATTLWLMIAWALAIPMRMSATTLLIAAFVVAAVSVVAWMRTRSIDIGTEAEPPIPRLAWLALVPLLAWIVFLLWRGYVAPPLGPDTLTYHMPRALLMARAGGYERFNLPDARIDATPANYELLLATMLDLARNDTLTEWLSTFFVLFFLLLTAAIARRWWSGGLPVPAAVLVVAGAPLIILQGATHKNDVMTGCFFLCAMHFSARWRSHPNIPSAILTIAGACAGIGTKPHGLALAGFVVLLCLGPIIRRQVSLRTIAALIAFAVIAMSLLGGAYYLDRFRHQPATAAAAPAIQTLTSSQWGDWRNVWQVPAMLLIAPFSPEDASVPVPFTGTDRLWGRYDTYASNYGAIVSLLAVALPLCIWRFGNSGDGDVIVERWHVSIAALLTLLVTLPMRAVPRGYVSGFPRYLVFILPIIVCWTVPPLIRAIEQHEAVNGRRYAMLITLLVAALFVANTSTYTLHDKWAPLSAIVWAAERPGVRWVPSETLRSEFFVDHYAADDAKIDVHGGPDSWIYPAFGRHLRRDVRYVNDISEVRPAAEWVIVDRAFNVIWVHPEFKEIKDWRRYLGHGVPTAEDVHVINQLARDPRFELVFLERHLIQAVFHRKVPPAVRTGR